MSVIMIDILVGASGSRELVEGTVDCLWLIYS